MSLKTLKIALMVVIGCIILSIVGSLIIWTGFKIQEFKSNRRKKKLQNEKVKEKSEKSNQDRDCKSEENMENIKNYENDESRNGEKASNNIDTVNQENQKSVIYIMNEIKSKEHDLRTGRMINMDNKNKKELLVNVLQLKLDSNTPASFLPMKMYYYGEANFEANKEMQESLEKLYEYEHANSPEKQMIKKYMDDLDMEIKRCEQAIIENENTKSKIEQKDLEIRLISRMETLSEVWTDLRDMIDPQD